MTRNELAEQIAQTGRDEMAEAITEYLASLDPQTYDAQYIDGVTDALNVIVQAGATDPR